MRVPPLRDRRDEIPHLSTFFLREACERLGKPDVQLAPATLDLFARYWWPGNVRQLRNEIQQAVWLSAPGGIVLPESAQNRPQRGEVIAVGDGHTKNDGNKVPLTVKEGDKVIFSPYGGEEIEVGDEKLLLLRESDILATY